MRWSLCLQQWKPWGALEVTLNCSWTVVSDQIGQQPAWMLMRPGWEFTAAKAVAVWERWRRQDRVSYSAFAKIIINSKVIYVYQVCSTEFPVKEFAFLAPSMQTYCCTCALKLSSECRFKAIKMAIVTPSGSWEQASSQGLASSPR